MLTRDQIELIQQEIDGVNTPEQSAAFRSLIEQNPEARALASELRAVVLAFDRVGEREPPPRLKQAILDALPRQRRATWSNILGDRVQAILGGGYMTRKAMLIGGTAVAAVLILVAGAVTGFPPVFNNAGTIGGVQQAARYRGRAMTEADVTLKNPEIQTLFQNDQILALVKSDAFREAMENAAFRELQSNEAYRALQDIDAYRQLQENDAYRQLENSEAFRRLEAQGAFRKALSAEDMRQLQDNEAFRQLQDNEAFRKLMDNEAFRQLQDNEAFRKLMDNEAFRQLQDNEAFRTLMDNEAFRLLQDNEAFRSLSRSAELSAVFMREAMRVEH